MSLARCCANRIIGLSNLNHPTYAMEPIFVLNSYTMHYEVLYNDSV